MLVTDHPRVRYEKLRTGFFEGMHEDNDSWDRFLLFGIYGLFHETTSHREYRVEVYQMPMRRWCGKTDLQTTLIREVFMQLIAIDHKENGHLIH